MALKGKKDSTLDRRLELCGGTLAGLLQEEGGLSSQHTVAHRQEGGQRGQVLACWLQLCHPQSLGETTGDKEWDVTSWAPQVSVQSWCEQEQSWALLGWDFLICSGLSQQIALPDPQAVHVWWG